MLRVRIVTISKVKQSFVLEGERHYLERLKSDAKVELQELDARGSVEQEADRLFESLKTGEYLFALDERGKEINSEQLAQLMQRLMNAGRSSLVFAIGGAHGFSPRVRERADYVLSLSKFTFPYQLTRLVLVEQIYRALSILKGSPYHKGES